VGLNHDFLSRAKKEREAKNNDKDGLEDAEKQIRTRSSLLPWNLKSLIEGQNRVNSLIQLPRVVSGTMTCTDLNHGEFRNERREKESEAKERIPDEVH
jgi:hypothetical protein